MSRIYIVFRTAITWLVLAAMAGLVGDAAITIAKEYRWFEASTSNLGAMLALLGEVRSLPWFWPTLAFAVGLAVGMWLDSVVRRIAERVAASSIKGRGIKVSLAPTYNFNGPLREYSAAVEFLSEARDIKVCLDYRQKSQGEDWNGWTRVTLMTKDFVAAKEWIYKTILKSDTHNQKRVVTIESDNDFNGKRRVIFGNNYAECVLIVFYNADGRNKNQRTPFVISAPLFPHAGWPEILSELKLDFRGMD